MVKVIVIYYSRTGNTKKMAEAVAEGAAGAGAFVQVKEAGAVEVQELKGYDVIVVGSPTYYGSMASQVKKLIDDSFVLHGKLEGKVGGAFSSSANIGGGNETTISDILNAMLIHGMIIRGDSLGDHYGPVAVGVPDERSLNECVRLGSRLAELAERVANLQGK